MDVLVERVKSCPTAAGCSEVLMPGEPEARQEDRRRREGIAFAPADLVELRAAADETGIPFFALHETPLGK
jgi:LDH2 family malate/lactate/ureidoglycolate dehydrogenase